MSATIIRPEFQLQVAGVDFVSTTGVEVKAGTIYARVYYAPNCVTSGQSIKGAIKLSDCINKGHRTIEFIAPAEAYSQLLKSCAESNMAVNRIRTRQLLEKCFAAPAAYRPEVIPNPWDTATHPVCLPAPVVPIQYQLCLPPAQAPFPAYKDSLTQFILSEDIEDKYAFILNYTPKTARRLCKNWNMFCKHVPDSLICDYAALKLQKLGVAPKAIRSFLKPSKSK